MYEAASDPYCYEGTAVLKNIPGIRDPTALAAFEAAITTQRADEPLPNGRFGARHYCAIHRHLFQDVYSWAGKFRTVRLTKDNSTFCYPENIDREMTRLFSDLANRDRLRGLSANPFAVAAAHFVTTLNAIHPFREGNGRTQTIFLALLAEWAGHPLSFERFSPGGFLVAMIASFAGQEEPLVAEISLLIAR